MVHVVHGGWALGRRALRSRLVLVAIIAALALVALSARLTERASGDEAARCGRFARTADARAASDAGPVDGRRVTVIGDSYSVGLGLARPVDSWPSRIAASLGARVHVDGFSGSGFSAGASDCGQVSYADRAPGAVRGADLVVVEGGLNDVDHSDAEIRAGFARLVRALGGHDVVVVGPVDAPSRSRAVPRVDALLAGLAAQQGATYLSMRDLDLPYLGDGLHLTAAGHRAFGDAVAAGLADLG